MRIRLDALRREPSPDRRRSRCPRPARARSLRLNVRIVGGLCTRVTCWRRSRARATSFVRNSSCLSSAAQVREGQDETAARRLPLPALRGRARLDPLGRAGGLSAAPATFPVLVRTAGREPYGGRTPRPFIAGYARHRPDRGIETNTLAHAFEPLRQIRRGTALVARRASLRSRSSGFRTEAVRDGV